MLLVFTIVSCYGKLKPAKFLSLKGRANFDQMKTSRNIWVKGSFDGSEKKGFLMQNFSLSQRLRNIEEHEKEREVR